MPGNKVFLYLAHLLQGGQPIQGYQNLLRRYYYEHPDKALLEQINAVRQMEALRAHSVQQTPLSSGMVSPSPPLGRYTAEVSHIPLTSPQFPLQAWKATWA